MLRTVRPVLLAVLVTLAVVGVSASSAASRDFNQTDAAFAAAMLPHHEGGLKLGKLAAEKGVDPDIRRLGRQIFNAQTREARTLRAMVREFRTKAAMSAPIEARDMREMRKLTRASGAKFDRMWLEVISGHHSAAIQMAQIQRRGGKNAEARLLARRIIAAQERELAEFNKLIKMAPAS